LSKHKEAAYKLIETVASRQIMRRFVTETSTIPARRSIIEDPELLEKNPWMHNLKVILAPDVDLVPDPAIPEFAELLDIVATSMEEARAGHKTVEEAYNDGQKKLEKLFKKAGYIK
jgi:multiple sugar transport system substrate-binding protein